MIGFAAPLGWLALLAIALPVVIHLIRRRASAEVPFAALAWLAASAPPLRQWRLDRRLLLAVRLLLLVLLAALLAEPWWRSPGVPQVAVLLAPGLDPVQAQAVVDAPLADWRWLASGHPPLDQPPPSAEQAGLFSLIRDFDRQLPAATALVVVVPEQLAGLDAERLRLGRRVDWRVLPGVALPPDEAGETPPLRVAIRAATSSTLTVARALLAAWRAAGVTVIADEAAAGTPVPADCTLLIVAGAAFDDVIQAQVKTGLNVLAGGSAEAAGAVLLRDGDGNPLLHRQLSGRGRIDVLAGPLDAAAWPALHDPQLPLRLLAVLRPPSAAPDRAPAASVAPLAATPAPGPAQSPNAWLALAAALLWLIERGLATRRRTTP